MPIGMRKWERSCAARSAALTAFARPPYMAAMALREIIILPDKRLRLVSEPVKKITADVRKLVEDMFETMYDAPGVGLAAIQVGAPKRVVTIDIAKKDEPKNAAGLHQSGDRHRQRREGDPRRRMSFDSGILR